MLNDETAERLRYKLYEAIDLELKDRWSEDFVRYSERNFQVDSHDGIDCRIHCCHCAVNRVLGVKEKTTV